MEEERGWIIRRRETLFRIINRNEFNVAIASSFYEVLGSKDRSMFTGGKKERGDSDLINIREETPNCHEYFLFLELHLHIEPRQRERKAIKRLSKPRCTGIEFGQSGMKSIQAIKTLRMIRRLL